MRKYNRRIKIPIIKYNPIFRNKLGHYQRDEWTSISDIGKKYDGFEFTFEEYVRIENLYVQAVFISLDFFHSDRVKINHIFKFKKKNDFDKYDGLKLFSTYQKLENGIIIKEKNIIAELIRLRLREHIAELELIIDTKSRTEILFGFDYYMYLKTNIEISPLLSQIKNLGLFTT